MKDLPVVVLKRCPEAIAVIVTLIACTVLAGWLLHIELIKSVGPGLATMKANTAIAFLLAGTTLWVRVHREPNSRSTRLSRILAAVVLLIGLVTLVEYGTGRSFGIDELLFRDTPGSVGTISPGRMSPATALFFVLLAVALFAPDTRVGRLIGQLLALTTLAGSMLGLMGYAYGIDSLYMIIPYSSMALHTAATFALLSVGTMLLRPNTQLMQILSSNTAAGILVRRLLPAALVLPLCFGWLRLRGQQAGFYDVRFGMALFTLLNVTVFTTLIYGTATVLYRIENERQRAEDKFRLVVEAAPNGTLMVNHDGRIVLVNSQTERMFGYERQELLGQPVEILLPDRFRPGHPSLRGAFFSNPRARPMGAGRELFGLRKNGSEVPIEIGLNPIETAEGVFVLSSIVDITERKSAAEQLERHQAEMAHVSRLSTMGEMATGLAHELNQPLFAITNYADGCQNLLNGNSQVPPRVRDILENITKEGHRAGEIIRRLRRFVSKLEPGRSSVDVNELVRDALALLAFDARNRGISVHFVPEDELPFVLGDSVQLEQVVVNLILNGFEAMDQNHATNRAIEIETRFRGSGSDAVEIAVSDKGIGLPTDGAERIFEAFFTTKPRGLGMGLSISRSIVEAHGGRLSAENRPGGGAVFRITLPVSAGVPVSTGVPAREP
jgi:two-component system cell cycle sensor histidine kinase/response regulator CckA